MFETEKYVKWYAKVTHLTALGYGNRNSIDSPNVGTLLINECVKGDVDKK